MIMKRRIDDDPIHGVLIGKLLELANGFVREIMRLGEWIGNPRPKFCNCCEDFLLGQWRFNARLLFVELTDRVGQRRTGSG